MVAWVVAPWVVVPFPWLMVVVGKTEWLVVAAEPVVVAAEVAPEVLAPPQTD